MKNSTGSTTAPTKSTLKAGTCPYCGGDMSTGHHAMGVCSAK